jgi:glutamine amidotransferase
MVGLVEQVGRKHGIADPMQMTLGISDGHSLYAFRYASAGPSRSLFHSASINAIKDIAPRARKFSADARAIVSEPLSDLAEAWIPVPESSFLTITGGNVSTEAFEPESA